MATVFIVSSHAHAADATDTQQYQLRARAMPADVRKWLARAISCYELRGEPPYDTQRAKDLAGQMRKAKCSRVQRDGTLLAEKYKRKPAVAKIVREAKRDFGKARKPIRN